MEKDKTMQILERFLPQLAKNDTYYMQTTEFITAFKALAEALKILRLENKNSTSSTMDKIEILVNDVISTHKTIETKADKSIALSDKVLAEYKTTVEKLQKEVEDFKSTVFEFKDGEDAKPEDVVPLVMAQIKLPEYKETVLDDGSEIKAKLESLSGEDRLDSSAIKNLPEAIQTGVRGIRTKVYTDGTSVTGDGTMSNPLVSTGSGATKFTDLTDTPANYTGAASKAVKVKADETGLEFVTLAAGGDMVLADVQSVTGKKTFDTTKLAVKGTSTGVTTIASANASANDYTHTLPAKTGTVAMTSDINAGTVTDVSVTTANGVSGSVATSTTTPAITLTLGAITPSTVNGNTLTTGTGTITITGTKTLTVSDTATVTGTNTGDNAANSQYSGLASSKQDTLTTSSDVPIGTIQLGHASDTTLARVSAGVISVEGVTIPSISSTNTLTNKRITKRVATTTDDATAVIDIDTCDTYELSAIVNTTEFTTTGTPTDGQTLMIRLKDAGVAKGLTWTGFTAIGVVLPTTTVAGKWHYVGCVYNLDATAWHVIAVGVQA